MLHWFYHLFNPHCQFCVDEKLAQQELLLAERECRTCLVLQQQLRNSELERTKLLELLVNKPVESIPVSEESYLPLGNKLINWDARRRELEAADRIKAQELKAAAIAREELAKQNEKLEKEVQNG